jgi:hypothetical protein
MQENREKRISLSVVVPVGGEVYMINGSSPNMRRRIKDCIIKIMRNIINTIKYILILLILILIGPIMLIIIKYKNKYDYYNKKIKFWKMLTISIILTLICWLLIVIYIINNKKN